MDIASERLLDVQMQIISDDEEDAGSGDFRFHHSVLRGRWQHTQHPQRLCVSEYVHGWNDTTHNLRG